MMEAGGIEPPLDSPRLPVGRGRQRAGAGDEHLRRLERLSPEVAGPHERNARLARSLAAGMEGIRRGAG